MALTECTQLFSTKDSSGHALPFPTYAKFYIYDHNGERWIDIGEYDISYSYGHILAEGDLYKIVPVPSEGFTIDPPSIEFTACKTSPIIFVYHKEDWLAEWAPAIIVSVVVAGAAFAAYAKMEE